MNQKIFFQTLKRSPLVDDVVAQLQKKISSGEIRCGDKIPTEPELMEQFGVGRSTIREAVGVLVHAGLLEKRQGFGTYLIADLNVQEPLDRRLRRAEILEVYEVRLMLELEIAKFAAGRREESDLQQMRQHLDNRAAALKQGDMNEYLNADISFHLSVAVASKNSVVIDLYRTFSSVLRDTLSMQVVGKSKEHDQTEASHENLYQAIQQKDVQAAVHWTLQNLDGAVSELRKSGDKQNA